MGIISIKSTDNLFWLGRYVERVFTTLRVFSEYYDKMIDKDENAYIDFCNKLGIENTYSYKQEFITKYLFDENDPNSVMSNLLCAYDNAVVMRNEISSETLSYIQMAVNYMEQGRETAHRCSNCRRYLTAYLPFGAAPTTLLNRRQREIY